MADDVDLLLRDADVPGPALGPVELDRLAAHVVDDGLRDELVSAVLETCDAVWDDGPRPDPDELGMRIGDWRLDLDRAAVRGGLRRTVLAGALVQQGHTQMMIAVVAAVVPSLVDVERVGSKAFPLPLHADVATGALSADQVYDRLPSHLHEIVDRLEFADLVLRLREAAEA